MQLVYGVLNPNYVFTLTQTLSLKGEGFLKSWPLLFFGDEVFFLLGEVFDFEGGKFIGPVFDSLI